MINHNQCLIITCVWTHNSNILWNEPWLCISHIITMYRYKLQISMCDTNIDDMRIKHKYKFYIIAWEQKSSPLKMNDKIWLFEITQTALSTIAFPCGTQNLTTLNIADRLGSFELACVLLRGCCSNSQNIS